MSEWNKQVMIIISVKQNSLKLGLSYEILCCAFGIAQGKTKTQEILVEVVIKSRKISRV